MQYLVKKSTVCKVSSLLLLLNFLMDANTVVDDVLTSVFDFS